MTPPHLQPGAIARLIADSVTTLDPLSREVIGILARKTLVDVVGDDPQDADRVIVIQAGRRISVLRDTLGAE